MVTLLTRSSNVSRGFTLIELLVVIAIIGLLSSVIIASLNTARFKGYDAERFSDLRNMQDAIEGYYEDNGGYPTTGGIWQSVCGSPFTATAQNSVVPRLVNKGYISSIPVGPQMNTSASPPTDCYAYNSNGTDYKFMDNLPNQFGGKTPAGTLMDPARSGSAWAVYSSGDMNL